MHIKPLSWALVPALILGVMALVFPLGPERTVASTALQEKLDASAPSIPTTSSRLPTGTGFEPAECPFENDQIPGDERIECGYLIIPEDRTQTGGRLIRLAVAILYSRSPNPAPDPVVFLEGGPGYGSLAGIEGWARSSLLDTHHLILFDQRGTGYSQPDMRCIEFSELVVQVQGQDISPPQAKAQAIQAASECWTRLTNQGIQLSAYNSAASAADLNDLRQALGFKEWNLFGISYGTRLALTAMRDYPQGIRSVVLDSVLPPQVDFYTDFGPRTARVFQAFFSECAADPTCVTAFPDLEPHYQELVKRLNADPLKVQAIDPETGQQETALIDGDLLAAILQGALYDSDLIPYLPLLIEQTYAGNRVPIQAIALHLINVFETVSHGMWYSVDCFEEAPFIDPETLQANLEAYPDFQQIGLAPRGYLISPTVLPICDVWQAGQAGRIENEPVYSDIPTLILAGELDPATPPTWSRLAASTLKNSFYYELPGSGHGVTTTSMCARSIRNEFFQDPSTAPDVTCLKEIDGPEFVASAHILRGLYPLATRLFLAPDALLIGLASFLGLLFLSAVAGWLLAILRARRIRPVNDSRVLWIARWGALSAMALDLTFLVGLAYFLWRTAVYESYLLLFGLPSSAGLLFALPWGSALLATALLVLAIAMWKNRIGTTTGQIFLLLTTLASLGFLGLLVYTELL